MLGGDRIGKDSVRIEAIGSIDELNAYLGVCLTVCDNPEWSLMLTRIQNQLFDLGSELACPPDGKFAIASISSADIEELERELDEMESELPALKEFILPGGAPLAAHIHFLRTLCRRAERSVFRLNGINPVRSEPIMYLNRLSDWLFCFSRLVNVRANVEEQKWKKRETK